MSTRALGILVLALGPVACAYPSDTASSGALPQTATTVQHLTRTRSWMLPQAKSGDLVYVSDQGLYYDTGVYVYSYPQGKQVGFLQPDYSESFEGLCSDGSGNVYVLGWTSRQSFIDEYAHGGTNPIKGLISSGIPSGCSVDPTSGNLAVANYEDPNARGYGDIAVYQNATGKPTYYYDSSIKYYYYCAYDNKGDLFADGNTDYINELPHNSSTLRHIYFNKHISPGSLKWNKSNLTIATLSGAKGPTRVDRVSVNGSGAKIIGSSNLDTYRDEGIYLDVEFWIQGSTIAGPGPNSAGPTKELYFWHYPAGGQAFKKIVAPKHSNFQGVTFSVAR